jgi:hypothetical protein
MKTNTKKTATKTAGYKYGKTTYRVKMIKDYVPRGMAVEYKKGTYVRVDDIGANGLPYIVAGHGLAVTFPKAVARLITVTERLPHALTKRIGGLKRALANLVNDRKRYYNDVFTTEDVLAIEREVLTRLAALKKAVAPKRPATAKN